MEDAGWIFSDEADSVMESLFSENKTAMLVVFADNNCCEEEDCDWYEGTDSDLDEEADSDSEDCSTLQPSPVQSPTRIDCKLQLPADRLSIKQALSE